jgi:glycosyltransferase involved in cell wall biosynthesis
MSSISLCLIVRNEEKVLPEFLQHLGACHDQFVVVDTGSTDRTVQILRAAGAEVHEVVWRDDFAWARNESLRHARCEWILVLDADEFPGTGFCDELRAAIADDDLGAATVCRHDEQRNGVIRINHPLRLFRRSPELHYQYRIHEDASESISNLLATSGKKLGALVTPIRHIGYSPVRLAETNKRDRDQHLLQLALQDDPNDLYSRYKLMEQYRFWSNGAGWREIAAQCLALLRSGQPIRPAHIAGDLVDMIRVGLYGNNIVDGLAFLREMDALAGSTGRYHISLGMLHESAGQLVPAFEHFNQALTLLNVDPERLLLETRALCGLARLSVSINDLPVAREFISAAAALAPDDAEVQTLLKLAAG